VNERALPKGKENKKSAQFLYDTVRCCFPWGEEGKHSESPVALETQRISRDLSVLPQRSA